MTYLVLGAFSGTMAGLLGVGGGLIIVPVLAWLFTSNGVAPGIIMHLAIGTSLAIIVVTSVSSVLAHHRHGAVQWTVFRQLTPGIIVGALTGAVIADALSSDVLRIVFGLFVLAIAAQMGFGRNPAPHRRLPAAVGMNLSGTVIGSVSALMGIGGGSLTVPFLSWCNVSLRQAVATSAACGLPIAVAGTAGFVVMGWNEDMLPDKAFGYVYVPALVSVIITSMLFAPVGARLAHRLPVATLKRVFAIFLVLVGLNMLWG